jgi:hypothetical protein
MAKKRKDKKYSKRGNYIALGSYTLDHIFTGLKHGKSFNDIKDNFLFECSLCNDLSGMEDEKILQLEVYIPLHGKYQRFNNHFDNFRNIYNYMFENKNNNMIIPFYGEDIS